MARAGKRALALRAVLADARLTPLTTRLARPTGAEHREELLALYSELGGLIETPVWRPGGWDLIFEGQLVVELDEQLHFNRYRALTLRSSWSAALPWTGPYLKYCADHEDRCLRDGRGQQRWTNASCSRNFSGGLPGDLKAGAPRWKQRAFYDAIKDTTPTTTLGIAIARVAIYDLVTGVPLDDILEGRVSAEPSDVLELVRARTVT